MKIISATIIQQRHGADIVSLRTDLPDGCFPYTAPLCLEFRCAKGSGIYYLEIHFPDVIIEHITLESTDVVPFSSEEDQ